MDPSKGKILVDEQFYELLKNSHDEKRNGLEAMLNHHIENDEKFQASINEKLELLARKNDRYEEFMSKIINGYSGGKMVMTIAITFITVLGLIGTAIYELVMALKKI